MTCPPGWLAPAFAVVFTLLFVTSETAARSGPGADDSVTRGRHLYAQCAACHSLDRNRAGPRHCGVVGRRAGSVPGFEYSPAMRRSNLVWAPKSLDAFLAAPMTYMPGTTMGYAGVESALDRQDIIAWLAWAGENSDRCTVEHGEANFEAADAAIHRR